MRFLIRELDYEQPIASGRLRYEQDGQPTGAIENWRWTEALDGYHFLRVDLNGQAAASGNNYLYHLTLNPDNRPERLMFRFWGPSGTERGNVLFEGGLVTLAREVRRGERREGLTIGEGLTYGEERGEETVNLAAATPFWFPSSVGLGLLAHATSGQALTLQQANEFALQLVDVEIEAGNEIELMVMNVAYAVRPLTISWADQQRTIWLDQHNQPLKMQRQDGLTAIETRYLRYR